MKYSPSIYARAFYEAVRDAQPADYDKLVGGFAALLARNGDISRKEAILGEIEKFYVRKDGGHIVKLEFARQQEGDLVRRLREAVAKEGDLVQISVNPSLTAGVRILIDGERELDKTMRRRLNQFTKLFNNF